MCPFLNGFRGRRRARRCILALAPGSPPASDHPRARTRYAVAAASAETPRPPCTCTAMVAAFDASSAMNTNADGANSGRSSGSLSRNQAARRARLRPPCTVIAMLASGWEMPCKRRDRHTQRVAGLGELRRDGHRLLNQPGQRRGHQYPPLIQRSLVFRQGLRPARQHDAGVGGSRIDPRHREPTDVVDLCRPGIEAEPHHVLTVANDDLIRDRSGWDEPTPTHAVVLWIERCEPLAADDIWFRRAQSGEQPCRTHMVDPWHGRQ